MSDQPKYRLIYVTLLFFLLLAIVLGLWGDKIIFKMGAFY
jgi:hypothetical protein